MVAVLDDARAGGKRGPMARLGGERMQPRWQLGLRDRLAVPVGDADQLVVEDDVVAGLRLLDAIDPGSRLAFGRKRTWTARLELTMLGDAPAVIGFDDAGRFDFAA